MPTDAHLTRLSPRQPRTPSAAVPGMTDTHHD